MYLQICCHKYFFVSIDNSVLRVSCMMLLKQNWCQLMTPLPNQEIVLLASYYHIYSWPWEYQQFLKTLSSLGWGFYNNPHPSHAAGRPVSAQLWSWLDNWTSWLDLGPSPSPYFSDDHQAVNRTCHYPQPCSEWCCGIVPLWVRSLPLPVHGQPRLLDCLPSWSSPTPAAPSQSTPIFLPTKAAFCMVSSQGYTTDVHNDSYIQ